MREFKFRFWNKKEEKMFFTHKDDLLPFVKRVICLDGCMEWDYVDNEDEFVVMQYTGIKDKDGKEIYEGDSIRYQVWESDGYKTGYGFVEWSDKSGWWVLINGKDEFMDGLTRVDLPRVIGNIYEKNKGEDSE